MRDSSCAASDVEFSWKGCNVGFKRETYKENPLFDDRLCNNAGERNNWKFNNSEMSSDFNVSFLDYLLFIYFILIIG